MAANGDSLKSCAEGWIGENPEADIAVYEVTDAAVTFNLANRINFSVQASSPLAFSCDDCDPLPLKFINHLTTVADGGGSLTDILDAAREIYDDNRDEFEDESEDEEESEISLSGSEETPMDLIKKAPKKPKALVNPEDYNTQAGSKSATFRLCTDLENIMKSDTKQFGFSCEPRDNNLYVWKIKCFDFDGEPLGDDLKKLASKGGLDHVEMEVKFPSDYPNAPPFVRVVQPRFMFHTGHVTIGGSICMEVLCRKGWNPTNDVEAIIIQIRSQMVAGDGRVDFGNPSPYSESEAQQAFDRVARHHNWN